MSRKHILAAVGLLMGLATTAALAHGDSHKARKVYDSGKAEETAFGRAGNPKKVTRTIKVGTTDGMRFTPSDIAVRQGETVKFIVSNRGKLLHEMVLGTDEDLKKHAELMRKFPGMEHEEAHMAHVKPGAAGEIVWQFTKPGEYGFACLIPGHFEAGMVGKVVVK